MTNWQDSPEAQRIFRQGWDAAAERVNKLEAEIEGLRLRITQDEMIEADMKREIERLRAALTEIKQLTPAILTGADTPAAHAAQRMGLIAERALTHEQNAPSYTKLEHKDGHWIEEGQSIPEWAEPKLCQHGVNVRQTICPSCAVRAYQER